MIIPAGKELGHGSGILLGDRHVLTCAHVVDMDFFRFAYDRETTHEQQCGANIALKQKAESRGVTATVRLYDGMERQATVEQVHAVLDMVLLRLDLPVPVAVHIRMPEADVILDSATGLTGLGVGRANDGSFRIISKPLSPSANESVGSRVSSFSGDADPGMSGGPIFLRAAEGYRLVGMLTLGGKTIDFARGIRDCEIAAFLRDVQTLSNWEGGSCGLPHDFITPVGSADDTIRWVRCAGADGDTDRSERESRLRAVRYIASQPLTLGNVDALLDVRRTALLTEARRSCLADFSADETGKVCALLSTRTGLAISPPDLVGFAAVTREMGNPPELESENDDRITNMPLATWQLRRVGNFAMAPEAALEWIDDGGLSKAFFDGSNLKPRRESIVLRATSRRRRALLRPALSVRLWDGVTIG
ncbi:serine protease [Neorhizobium sp. NCHU2750]|uniref:S1 family peptidase n=1 Tax=Neorhizobium sp. NCHU2750 TaxID=1825976 RepID=UPI0013C45FFE